MDKKNVKKLIDFITKEPTEDDHKKGHKYPFISAEILNAEINKIMDFFLMPDNELEQKEKILKNIDNELSLSDEFTDSLKTKQSNESQKADGEMETGKNFEENETAEIKEEKDDFMDVIEENQENKAIENNSNNKEANTEEDNSENKKEIELEGEKETFQPTKLDEQSDKIELLEYLLEFINTNNELNYVLAGYFSKFFISLLNRNSAAVRNDLDFFRFFKIL